MDYVYILRCPIDGLVKYVGHTRYPLLRKGQHLGRSNTNKFQPELNEWKKRLRVLELAPIFEVIETVPAGKGKSRERETIRKITDQGGYVFNIYHNRMNPPPAASRPELTEIQKEVFNQIRSFMRSTGFVPTYREIKDHYGWNSTNAVHGHIRALERKGLIEFRGKRYRVLP